MSLTITNYFDQVKKVDFSKLPPAIQKSHDLVKRVGTGSEPWANYHGSEQIRSMIDKYFHAMDFVMSSHPEWQAASPKAAKPVPAPKAAKPAKAAKLVPAPKVPKAAPTPKTAEKEAASKAAKPAAAPKAAKQHTYKPKFSQNQNVKVKIDGGEYVGVVHGWERSSDAKVRFTYAVQVGGKERFGIEESKVRFGIEEKNLTARKAPKQKPADTREQVAHLDSDVVFMQSFLRLVDKPVTVEQVRGLHRKMEKGITKQQVRLRSQHAADLQEMADLVAKTYVHMTDNEVGRVDKLEFDNPVVSRARAVVAGVRVATSIGLLSRFINMQGTVPDAKAVAQLSKALSADYAEHPNSDYAVAIGAADAVLKNWKPGKTVQITKQQLQGLSGLGCPDTPSGQACGCRSKKAGR